MGTQHHFNPLYRHWKILANRREFCIDWMKSSFCAFVGWFWGAKVSSEIVEYGTEKLGFLRQLSDFRHGIPSHDTLATVFRALDPASFNAVFAQCGVCSMGGRLERVH